jgi:polyhydroxyalkanoate synthesis regulator phasin
MFDILKKTYLAGLGLALLTKEKTEELVDELIAKGEVAEKDRRKVTEDLLNRAKEEQQKFSQAVKENVRKVLGEMKFPSRSNWEDLNKRVEELEKRVMTETDSESENDSSA